MKRSCRYDQRTTLPDLRTKVCGAASCFVVVQGRSYCDQHEKQRSEQRRDREQHNPYNNRRWLRASISYRKRHPRCEMCIAKGEQTPRLSQAVDHIVPIRQGGAFWDQNNWQALCHRCHNSDKRRQDNQRAKGVAAKN